MAKILSHITLAVLLVLSATGMTINVHYCQGHLYDMALNAPAHSCCDADMETRSCHHDQARADTHHCEDETVTIESTSDYVISGLTYHFENNHTNDLFLITLLLAENPGIEDIESWQYFSENKPPPIQAVDLSRLQRFLI